MLFLFVAFALATAATFLVVRSARTHGHLSGDSDMSGPQKFHARAVPRIGGLGIVAGLLGSLLLMWIMLGREALVGVLVLVAGAPAFLGGFAEDLTKTQSPGRRLLLTACSAAVAIALLGAVLDRAHIPGVEWLVTTFPIAAMLLTVLCVTGISNAVNIIDGFNGLASMCVVMMLAGIAYVAFQAGDPMIAFCALAGVGAVLGFFVWNYPAGMIFLGDGGAYFLGFYFAELSVLLIYRNPDVSPLCPLLMCIYPVFETLFSIYRRKFVRGRPVGMPDGVHLHSLIYRRMLRWAVGRQEAKILTRRNSMTSPYLWILCMLAVVPSMLLWDRSGWLSAFIVLFVASYMLLYSRIVRFKSPGWLIIRR